MQVLITHSSLAPSRVLHFSRWQLLGVLFGVTLSPRDLFACASVGAMAGLIGERRQERKGSAA